MAAYWRWVSAFLTGCSLICVAAAWMVFAPIPLGGQVAYVMINGNSMEPIFHTGDLMIVHQVSNYQVGDIVAYLDAKLGRYVFHRIIGQHLDHYIFKGDHNTWIDSYQPTASELIGKEWIYLPQAGKAILWLRTPISLALIVGILVFIVLALAIRSKNKHGRKKEAMHTRLSSLKSRLAQILQSRQTGNSESKTGADKPTSDLILAPAGVSDNLVPTNLLNFKPSSELIEGVFFAFGLLAFASLLLTIIAFTHPLSQSIPNNIQYQQIGSFSYTAAASGNVYDSGRLTTGDPVFPKLNCTLNLQFNYFLVGDHLAGLTGTHQLSARVSEDISGWQRTIPLENETTFTGNAFNTSATIDLCNLENTVATMERETALQSASYSLTIDPQIKIAGKIAEQDLKDTFNPPLVFQFDKIHAYLFKSDAAPNPLNPTQTGIIKSSHSIANTLPFLSLQIEVWILRTVSIFGLGLSLAVLLILWRYVFHFATSDPESLTRMKYGPLLVDVQNRALETSSNPIQVTALEDLAKLAEQHNTMILHMSHGLFHDYYVQADRFTYRYSLQPEGRDPQPSPDGGMAQSLRQGIARSEFQEFYQPIVSLTDGKITAVEALLRWQHPQRGLVPAAEFMPTAEETGLIDTIDAWLLKVALTQIKQLQEGGLQVKLSVNRSLMQLQDDLIDNLFQALQENEMDPQTLQIEIQENDLLEHIHTILPVLQKLKDRGIPVAVDDFTGAAALYSLQSFPIAAVKIDKKYIENLNDPLKSGAVSDIIAEAALRGWDVIAKGVETEEQLSLLQKQLCPHAQGYFLGKPAPGFEVKKLIQKEPSQTFPKKARRQRIAREKGG
jgi:signal peptidase I